MGSLIILIDLNKTYETIEVKGRVFFSEKFIKSFLKKKSGGRKTDFFKLNLSKFRMQEF